MFCYKAKFALLCMAGLLIVFHYSKASEYDEDSESQESLHDLGRSELSVGEMKSEDVKILQTSLDAKLRRRFARRRRIYVNRRRLLRRSWAWR